jgi:hypothetical protein
MTYLKRITLLVLVVGILVLLASCGTQINNASKENVAIMGQWEDIGQNILQHIPNYEEYNDRLYTGFGNLVVLSNGELFLTLNRDYGMFRSTDTGNSWEKVSDVQVQGRAYGGFSANIDYQNNRFALFMIVSSVDPQSAITLDGGKTWNEITRPTHIVHDGWTWGAVDWTNDNPQVIIGKQHHDMTAMWLSKDAGQSWEKLAFRSRNPGVINDRILVAALGEYGEGIYRSVDQGQTWNQVSDYKITGKVPVKFNNNFYWTSENGVLVTKNEGETWSLLGTNLPGALWGPFFGKDENTILAVCLDGYYKTTNGGKEWQKIAEHLEGFEPDVMHPTASFGWDYNKNILYFSPVGGSLLRYNY